MALPDPDEDHLLPTTAYPTNGYPPSSPRTKRHHGWIFASPPCVVLCLISLVLIGLLSYQAFAGQWGLTTLSWGVPSPILDGIDEDLAPPPMKVVEPWTLDRLEGLVNQTRGYFARDYSLWLGWNNMRYIIEASVLQASLLNRTLIIPSFVYARHCEYPLGVCAAFAEMVNRGDAMGSDQWRLLSWEEQMGWKVPMEKMIDMQGLRDAHAVVTMSEYLSLRSLPPTLEQGNGQWSDDIYQVQSRSIPNSEWDPPEVIRVDQERPPFVLDETEPRTVRAFQAREAVKTMVEDLMENKSENRLHQKLLDWDEVLETMQNMQVDMNDDDDIELFLRAADFEVLHTYRGVRDHEFVKSVATPIKQVARMSEVHGCVDDYGSWDDEVVLLQGEVHDNRKPGFMRFTSTDNMQSFTRSVLYDLRSLHSLAALATRIDERMRERTGGRMWRAAHLRRGDFMQMGWAEWTLERDLELVKSNLDRAPEIWQQIRNSTTAKTYEIPDVCPNAALCEGEIPRSDDPFYIATDERSPYSLDYIRSQGGVLIMDLLTRDDRQLASWPLLFTDILALAEQHVMARAAYFYGNGMSSVTGGVLNLRAINGWDPRTAAYRE